MNTMLDQQIQTCIQECHRCHDRCLETILHCLEISGDHAAPDHIRMLMDCIEIWQTSANFMLRMSNFHGDPAGSAPGSVSSAPRIVSVLGMTR
jgi:hypothetical protein